jgi:hypothetical protein
LSDFQENIRNESFFMIQGLPRLPKLEPKEWQIQAKAAVQGVLVSLMGKEYPIAFVKNSTGRGKESKTMYRVKMPSVEISREIRDKFGLFFSGGADTRPQSLKGISIRNAVTTATLARIAILQLLGQRYVQSNPGSRSHVVGYEPRPLLKLTPSPGASDKRIQTYNFIEAVTKLPTCFQKGEIDGLLKRISPKLHGNLKPLLVVVSDDMIRKSISMPKSRPADASGSGSESSGSFKSPGDVSGRVSNKRGASGPAHGSSVNKKK